ncbi:TrmH family RNA methyltransferase, partial [Lysobacter sp. 1R34A]|uniref:TrmH family RNA methyltransferase n=1 Tax=Lysobacter sp. 1R34A TaxID=3445786 RepID=UPI003EED9DDC
MNPDLRNPPAPPEAPDPINSPARSPEAAPAAAAGRLGPATAQDPAAAHTRIVLVGTQHPGNIGSAARAMKTMGLSRLILVAPEKGLDRDAYAMAAGADDLLESALIVPDLATAVADCHLVLGCTARSRRIALEELVPRDAAARA